MRKMNRTQRLALAGAFLAVSGSAAMAQTSVVNFPTLPDGADWVTGLTTLFTSSAGLGLGILGLGLVVAMIIAGLRARKGKG